MTDTLADLMHANLMGVFNERDDAARAATAERIYSADVAFVEPGGTITGRDAIASRAGDLLADGPAFVFAPVGEPYTSDGLAYLEWQFGPAGGAPVVRGMDIALIADGAITRLHTFLRR
jgi:hypothetical protein